MVIIKNINIEEKQLTTRKIDVPSLSQKDEITCINQLYLSNTCDYESILKSEIKSKINSYKQQDIKKKKYDEENFVTFDYVIEKLLCSKLKCYYCTGRVKIFYDLCKDENQWTLDRINNETGHNDGNVLISCLDCNLKRRKLDKDKFNFTKKMRIKKLN